MPRRPWRSVSIIRWKIERAADTLKGKQFYWKRPFCVLIATIFLDCSSSGVCWYALAKSSFEKVFPLASDAKRSSNLGRVTVNLGILIY